MIDSSPIEEWGEQVSVFWTFGPDGSVGTWILTILGVIVMVAAWVGWVWLENQKLTRQAEALRASGALPVPAGPVHGPAPSEPPLAGPATKPPE